MASPPTAFKVKGLKGLTVALDWKKYAVASGAKLRAATVFNGKLAEAAVRKQLQKGMDPRNAALTQAIKGGDKPLVDSAELFNSVTSTPISDTEVFVGVKRSSREYNVAALIHEGTTITVTPAMRGMFFYLWKASTGDISPDKLTGRAAELWKRMQKDWKPLKAETKTITIPARPFITIALSSGQLRGLCKFNWERAMGTVFKERADAGRNTKDD